jgi:hypothetical protein
MKTKRKISGYILRGSAAALLLSCAVVALCSAINLPNDPPKVQKPKPTKVRIVSVLPMTINKGATAKFTVAASAAVTQATTVNYSLGGTGSLGKHYTVDGIPGQVTIQAGRSSADVTVQSLLTNLTAGSETVVVTLQAGTGYKVAKVKRHSQPPTLTILNEIPSPIVITGISDSAPTPLTPVQLKTTGLKPGLPVSVTFSGPDGFSVWKPPIRVGTDGSVIVAVPPYVDPHAGQIGAGSVSISVSQGANQSVPVPVTIKNLPPVSADGSSSANTTYDGCYDGTLSERIACGPTVTNHAATIEFTLFDRVITGSGVSGLFTVSFNGTVNSGTWSARGPGIGGTEVGTWSATRQVPGSSGDYDGTYTGTFSPGAGHFTFTLTNGAITGSGGASGAVTFSFTGTVNNGTWSISGWSRIQQGCTASGTWSATQQVVDLPNIIPRFQCSQGTPVRSCPPTPSHCTANCHTNDCTDQTPWACYPYDHPTSQDPCNTICKNGCLLTDLSMGLNYVSQTFGLPLPFIVSDPGGLNSFLNTNCNQPPRACAFGYANNGALFPALATAQVDQASPSTVGHYKWVPLDSQVYDTRNNPTKTMSVLNSILCGSYMNYPAAPVIVEVQGRDGPRSHYVLVYGKNQQGDYQIVDPGHRGYTSLTGFPYNKSFALRGFVTDPPDPSALGVESEGNADVLVIDPTGLQTGFDPSTGTFVNTIPQSAHDTDQIDADDGTSGTIGPWYSVGVDRPPQGTYQVLVTGKNSGPYTVTIHGISRDGSLQRPSVITGTLAPGAVARFQVNYSPTPGSHINVVPVTRLGNISTRAFVQTGDNVMIGGFIVQGTGSKRVIIRAIGPELTQYGVPNALANPTLELHNGTGALIASNDNWRTTIIGGSISGDQVSEIRDSGHAPTDGRESAIIADLPAGNYTAIVRGVNSITGVALVEVYDLSNDTASILGNISTRTFVQTNDNVMIGGFIVQGTGAKRVIIRAIGPELSQYGVPDPLANPRLELHNAAGALIGSNDDWQQTIIGGVITRNQVPDIQNSGHAPADPSESAIIAELQPGNYTAIVRGVNDTTGVGLVEVYDLQ